jgi:hypothetical protein
MRDKHQLPLPLSSIVSIKFPDTSIKPCQKDGALHQSHLGSVPAVMVLHFGFSSQNHHPFTSIIIRFDEHPLLVGTS